MARYREKKSAVLRVAPADAKAWRAPRFPLSRPRRAIVLQEKILADIDRVIVPGMVHVGPSDVPRRYFGWTTTAPGILGEIAAPLNVNAMAHVTGVRTGNACHRLVAAVVAFAE